jgi:hypothetical protein
LDNLFKGTSKNYPFPLFPKGIKGEVAKEVRVFRGYLNLKQIEMVSNSKMKISKDLQGKKLFIEREFNAPRDLVWRAWTESDLRDKWWMPKPWVAKKKRLRLK